MTDKLINRRKNNDRRNGEDRRKIIRRSSDVYPPLNSNEWKIILYDNLEHFAEKYLISLSELKILLEDLITQKDNHE
jgi:hypothetical protein